MTLKEAQCRQESFHANFNNIICNHRDSAEPLHSEKGKDLGFWVCRICGMVYISRYQPLSTAELESLENLATSGR